MGFEIKNGVLKKYYKEPGVTEVVIPDSVTSIGDGAFGWCKSLTSVTISGHKFNISSRSLFDISSPSLTLKLYKELKNKVKK